MSIIVDEDWYNIYTSNVLHPTVDNQKKYIESEDYQERVNGKSPEEMMSPTLHLKGDDFIDTSPMLSTFNQSMSSLYYEDLSTLNSPYDLSLKYEPTFSPITPDIQLENTTMQSPNHFSFSQEDIDFMMNAPMTPDTLYNHFDYDSSKVLDLNHLEYIDVDGKFDES